MNTTSQISLAHLRRGKQNRYNPLSTLTNPDDVAKKLDQFEAGYLKDIAHIWDALEQRDDLIRAVVAKRKKAVARQGWTVLINESLPDDRRSEAEAHAAALEHFYQNLRCENALDRAEQGGFKLLCRQMMDAVGKRFAVHEIVWETTTRASSIQPSRTGGSERDSAVVDACTLNPNPNPNLLTATFRFVPLSFFENTTGELRFLESEASLTGIPLEPGAWMVTVGDGLMAATANAWVLKQTTLNDWLTYSERNGRPGLRGTTAAAPDSPDWNALETALNNVLDGGAVVHSASDDIKVIDLAAGGHIPFPELVDRMDRMIAALWRGADLSTISRDRGYGASLQEKETCSLEEDDAEMLTETLNRYVDAWVIRYLFGEDAEPLANVKILVSPKECTTGDIQIDQFLYQIGAPLALDDLMSRYGRALPKPGEAVVCVKPDERVLQLKDASFKHPTFPPLPPLKESRSSLLSSRSSAEHLLPASHPESSHNATMPVPIPNTADAQEDSEIPVTSRDGSPPDLKTVTGPTEAVSTPDQSCERMADAEFIDLSLLQNGSCPVLSVPFAVDDSGPGPLSPAAPVENCSPLPLLPHVQNSSLPNEFDLLQPDWVQLSPYGDFPHVRGIQRVTRTAAEIMVKQFNSFRARLGRLFGGAPFYVGHPDIPNSSELADRKAYGWIMQLEARDDGLYGFVKWSDAGLELLKQGHYKYLSPHWQVESIGTEKGRTVYQPVALVSVGLTNQPNIPVKPLANEIAPSNEPQRGSTAEPTVATEELPWVSNDDAANTNGVAASPSSDESSIIVTGDSVSAVPSTPPENEQQLITQNSTALLPPVENPRLSAASAVETPLSSVISVPSVVNNSLVAPTISAPPREPDPFSPRLSNFALTHMHTHSITDHIGRRRREFTHLGNSRNTNDRIQEAVRARMQLDYTYNEAWEFVKRQHPEWFTTSEALGVR